MRRTNSHMRRAIDSQGLMWFCMLSWLSDKRAQDALKNKDQAEFKK